MVSKILTMARRLGLRAILLAISLMGFATHSEAQEVQIDLTKPFQAHAFPHFWERMFGSGRAALVLRESYQTDLATTRAQLPIQFVRFHGIFLDELGVYAINPKTHQPIYNFTYVDQIYDALLNQHVKPFVELSFMPLAMASQPGKKFSFWYKPNVTPPQNLADWDDLITQFTRHLLARYGEQEVASWYFEVWNEPNIGFWEGKPAQKTYFELYDHTARAIKAVNASIKVGGPSTAQAAWAYEFLKHAADDHVPVDFVSSHVYANDTNHDVFHHTGLIPRDQMVCQAVRKVHDDIARSPLPSVPLIFSEYNASYSNEPNVTDTDYMGPWLATTIAQCDGLTQMMSLWTFSDVFEEQGVPTTPFYGGFGLIATGHLPKPAFNALSILHHLGNQRLLLDNPNALLTRRDNGTLVLAVWNYADPDGTGPQYTPPAAATSRSFHLTLPTTVHHATIYRVDRTHGNVIEVFDALGRPDTPSLAQHAELARAAQLPPPEKLTLTRADLTLDVPRHGLAVIELE